MPQKIIGLDIGSSSLKATLIKGTLGGYQFVSFHEIRYPDEPDLPEGDRLKQAVEQLMGEMTLNPDRFVAALPGSLTSFRTLTLPFTDKKKIAQTLLFEVEGHIPFNIDECIIDHQVIRTTEDASQVLVAIAKKSDLKNYIELLQYAQADPFVLEPGPTSLAHTLRDTMDNVPGVFALLDLGASGSSFCIIGNGKLEMVRFIPFGGNMITGAIAKSLGLSLEDAERVKQETGLILLSPEEIEDQRAVEVSDAIRKGLIPLLRDLRRTLL
ncbi:pilus assembly protein PilM, partial [Thermodesulfobacteriota bacterium]